MSENLEKQLLNPHEDFERPPMSLSPDGQPLEPPPGDQLLPNTFWDRASVGSFTEFTDLPGYKNVTAGVGLNLPFPSDSTKVTAGVEARASIFSTHKGAQITKGILPSLRVTQDLGKNAQLMARISPSPNEYAKIGVQFNF